MTDSPDRLRDRAAADPQSITPRELVQALESNPSASAVVGETLLALGDDRRSRAVGALSTLFDHDDPSVRSGAAAAIHVCVGTDPEAGMEIASDLDSLLTDEYPVARKHAGMALREVALEDPAVTVTAVETLDGLLKPDHPDLLAPGLDLVNAVADADPDAAVTLLEPLVETLATIAELDIEPPASGAGVSAAARESLGQYTTEMGRQRDRLAGVIGTILVARPTALRPIRSSYIGLLSHDGTGPGRATLAETLGHVAESQPDDVAPCIDTLSDLLGDRDVNVASAAAWSLGMLADTHGEQVAAATTTNVDDLVELLEVDQARAPVSSAILLSYVGEHQPSTIRSVSDRLLAHLENDQPDVRASVALALGYAGAEPAIPALQERAERDSREPVREAARDALDRIGA